MTYGASWLIGNTTGASANASKLEFKGTGASAFADIAAGNFAICGWFSDSRSSGGTDGAIFAINTAGDLTEWLTVETARAKGGAAHYTVRCFWRMSGDTNATVAHATSNEPYNVGTVYMWVVYRSGNNLVCGVLDGNAGVGSKLVTATDAMNMDANKTFATLAGSAGSVISMGSRGYDSSWNAGHWGWTAVLDFSNPASAADPATLDWEMLLSNPYKLLRLYHPTTGSSTSTGALRAWWGKVQKDGADYDPTSWTNDFEAFDGGSVFTLVDGIGDGIDLTLTETGGGTKSITSISAANPSVITVASHGYADGELVEIASSNSTPVVDGTHNITYLSTNTFSVPVNVTVAGNTGTVRGYPDFRVFPAYTPPSWGGELFQLSFGGQTPKSCSDGNGGRYLCSRFGWQRKGGEAAFELSHVDSDGNRDRWGLPILMGGQNLLTTGPTLTRSDNPVYTESSLPGIIDYHHDITVVPRTATELVVMQQGHALRSSNNAPTNTDYWINFPCFTRHTIDANGDIADTDIQDPTCNDIGTGVIATPSATIGDYSTAVSTYCAANVINENVVWGVRAGGGGGAVLGAIRVTAASHEALKLTTNDGVLHHQNKPWCVGIMPSNTAMMVYVVRDLPASNRASSYKGLHALWCSDLSNFTDITKWYNPVTGVALATQINNNSHANLIHTAPGDSETDAVWADCIFNDLGDVFGVYGVNEADATITARFGVDPLQVHPSMIECDFRRFFRRTGWTSAAAKWSNYQDLDIDQMILDMSNDSAAWAIDNQWNTAGDNHVVDDSFTPVTQLGSLWKSPILQWIDAQQRIVACFFSDPEGSAYNIDTQFPLQRDWGNSVAVAFIDTAAMRAWVPSSPTIYTKASGALACRPQRWMAPQESGTQILVEIAVKNDLVTSTERGNVQRRIVDFSALANAAKAVLGGGGMRSRVRGRGR